MRNRNGEREILKTPASLLPDSPTLTLRLTAALGRDGQERRPVKILRRTLPPFMCTFPNEIVTCRLPDGHRRRVFIKYQAGQSHDCFGHRGNVPYETEVYRRVLHPLADFRPKYLGAHTDANTGNISLFLEYVHRSIRASDIVWNRMARQPRALGQAACWIGQFHAEHGERINDPSLAFLRHYGAEYYRGWAQRTLEFSRPLHGRFPWLTILCGTDEWFAPLLVEPQTVIHGEFYAKTILVQNQRVFIVDWESAAIAAGEIDLAALTEGKHWPASVVQKCERAYVRARWREGAPPSFRRTLDAARIYLHFRWLGERPDWTLRQKSVSRYEHLHASAKRLGLI